MATTDAVDDLVGALDEAPHRSEDLRSRILPPEMLDLPARVTEAIRDSNQQVMALSSRVRALERVVAAPPDESVELLKPQFDSLSLNLDNLTRRLVRYETDIGLFRSRHAREVMRERSGILATELGYRKIRTLTTDDLCDFVDKADTHGIDTSDLRSFRRADLVVEAADADESCYLAVEISFTVDGRDTRRAIRNARLLKRFTGNRSHPVVAGVRKDRDVDSQLHAGNVYWFELDDSDLETD